MRVLIVDFYYPAFLRSWQSRRRDLTGHPYAEQWRALMDEAFGTADFYSRHLNALGWEAAEIVANCEPLQRRWAEEHGLRVPYRPLRWTVGRRGGLPWPVRTPDDRWVLRVLEAQIRAWRPDVLYVQEMIALPPAFLRAVRPWVRLIAGQNACWIPPGADFSEYDLVLSSLPHYVERFRRSGLEAELLRLAFEPAVLEQLPAEERDLPLTHVGGYGKVHEERNRLLETLLEHGLPLQCRGYAIDHTRPQSPLRRAWQGEAWAREMYRIRHRSRIAVTRHTFVAGEHANILSLYEATGCGAMLLVDRRGDLAEIFEPGRECVAYADEGECARLARHYLEHDAEREPIAAAGRARTLRQHTYARRMEELSAILSRHLRRPKPRTPAAAPSPLRAAGGRS